MLSIRRAGSNICRTVHKQTFLPPPSRIQSIWSFPIDQPASLLEVFKRVFRQTGEEKALAAVALMMEGPVVDLDADLALRAATLGHEEKLPLADSVIPATARKFDAIVWTRDSDFNHLEV